MQLETGSSARRETANGRIPWYALHWPRRKEIFEQPKVLVQGIRNLQLTRRIVAAVDEQSYYAGVNLCVIIPHNATTLTLYALLGLLNSRVVNFWFSHSYVDHRIKNIQLEAIPIPSGSPAFAKISVEVDSKVRELVDALQKAGCASDGTASVWATRAAASRERVELLIEDLYGLDEETRQLIRGAPCNAAPRSRGM